MLKTGYATDGMHDSDISLYILQNEHKSRKTGALIDKMKEDINGYKNEINLLLTNETLFASVLFPCMLSRVKKKTKKTSRLNTYQIHM